MLPSLSHFVTWFYEKSKKIYTQIQSVITQLWTEIKGISVFSHFRVCTWRNTICTHHIFFLRDKRKKEGEVTTCRKEAVSCHKERVIIPHLGPIPGSQIWSRGWTPTATRTRKLRLYYICATSGGTDPLLQCKDKLSLASPKQGFYVSIVCLGQSVLH